MSDYASVLTLYIYIYICMCVAYFMFKSEKAQHMCD